jgi:hypothetical protein
MRCREYTRGGQPPSLTLKMLYSQYRPRREALEERHSDQQGNRHSCEPAFSVSVITNEASYILSSRVRSFGDTEGFVAFRARKRWRWVIIG